MNESIFSTSKDRDAVVNLKVLVRDLDLDIVKGIVRTAKEDAD